MIVKNGIELGLGGDRELPRLAYRVNDAAKMIGISRSKLYGLARKRKLIILKLDGRSVVPSDSLKNYLASLNPLHQ